MRKYMAILWNLVLCVLLLNSCGSTGFITGLGDGKMAGNIGGYVAPSFVFDPNAIVSGMITSGDLAPNTVYSGNIASGQIGNVHIQDGTIITADIASGQVQSGQLGSGAVTGQAGNGAFNIASGTISTNDLGSGSIVSGSIASGQIGQFHHSSGSVTSGAISSGVIGSFHIASGGVLSGNISSGQIGQFHHSSGSVTSGSISSGVIGTFHIASGQLTGFELGSGAIVSGRIASGQVGNNAIASGGVLSGNIASGQIGQFHHSSGSITSGAISSGVIGTNHISSGTIVTNGRYVFDDSLTCSESISGVRAVSISQSGYLQVAMASVSGRMPAIGIVQNNFLSGATVTFYTQGKFQFGSGMVDYSGRIGKPVWVGRSGHLITASGAWNSGGFSSGDLVQTLGTILNSGAIWASIIPIVQSGDLVSAFGVIG